MCPRLSSAVLWLLPAGLLLLPFAASADETLSGKRELCQTEARQQIKPRRSHDPSLYSIALDARQAYIRECMARARAEPVTTGAVEKTPPLRSPAATRQNIGKAQKPNDGH